MKMKNLITLIALTLASLSINAQQISWSNLVKSHGGVAQVIPYNGSQFFTERAIGRGRNSKMELSYHNNMEIEVSMPINVKLPTGGGIIESVSRLGDKVIVFLSDRQQGVNTLYYQLYSTECTPLDDPKEILSYDFPESRRSSGGSYAVRNSANGEYLCIEYLLPGRKDDVDRFGFKVLNKDLAVVKTGEYESSFNANVFDIRQRYVSNQGDYYLLAIVNNTNARGKVKDINDIASSMIIRLDGQRQDVMEISLSKAESMRESDFFCDEKGNIRMVGMGSKGGAEGIVYLLIDFNARKMLQESFQPVTRDLTQTISEKQLRKAGDKEIRGRAIPDYQNYSFTEGLISDDGSMTGIMERYYVVIVTTTDSKGFSTVTSRYHYDDLLVYRVNADGTFAYATTIVKRQLSINDSGYLSSFGSYADDKNLHLFFNDNAMNYDESGHFSVPEGKIVLAAFKKKTNAVAEVVLDKETGAFTRDLAFSHAETGAYAIPRYSGVDYELGEMLILLRAVGKEKFGLIKF
jgi:hypothetical protein